MTDRLLSNQFNYKSGYKSPDGIVYFGCIEGLVSFNPETLLGRKTDYVPPIYITGFSLLNEKVVVGGRNSPLCKASSVRIRSA